MSAKYFLPSNATFAFPTIFSAMSVIALLRLISTSSSSLFAILTVLNCSKSKIFNSSVLSFMLIRLNDYCFYSSTQLKCFTVSWRLFFRLQAINLQQLKPGQQCQIVDGIVFLISVDMPNHFIAWYLTMMLPPNIFSPAHPYVRLCHFYPNCLTLPAFSIQFLLQNRRNTFFKAILRNHYRRFSILPTILPFTKSARMIAIKSITTANFSNGIGANRSLKTL
ncbi:hypothetical protein appser4_20830 [Actinobacillus pleuropneumoniae serovar 4 str. M62]|nr:hypothetical protein appser4_20830 [Actinobacillus pleuropneumoniae serovar 4 str. M62]